MTEYGLSRPAKRGHERIALAFLKGEPDSLRSDETDGEQLTYHGKAIAWRDGDTYRLTLAQYNTKTTRQRLNTLLTLMDIPYQVHKVNGDALIVGRDERIKLVAGDVIAIDGGKRLSVQSRYGADWIQVS